MKPTRQYPLGPFQSPRGRPTTIPSDRSILHHNSFPVPRGIELLGTDPLVREKSGYHPKLPSPSLQGGAATIIHQQTGIERRWDPGRSLPPRRKELRSHQQNSPLLRPRGGKCSNLSLCLSNDPIRKNSGRSLLWQVRWRYSLCLIDRLSGISWRFAKSMVYSPGRV